MICMFLRRLCPCILELVLNSTAVTWHQKNWCQLCCHCSGVYLNLGILLTLHYIKTDQFTAANINCNKMNSKRVDPDLKQIGSATNSAVHAVTPDFLREEMLVVR